VSRRVAIALTSCGDRRRQDAPKENPAQRNAARGQCVDTEIRLAVAGKKRKTKPATRRAWGVSLTVVAAARRGSGAPRRVSCDPRRRSGTRGTAGGCGAVGRRRLRRRRDPTNRLVRSARGNGCHRLGLDLARCLGHLDFGSDPWRDRARHADTPGAVGELGVGVGLRVGRRGHFSVSRLRAALCCPHPHYAAQCVQCQALCKEIFLGALQSQIRPCG